MAEPSALTAASAHEFVVATDVSQNESAYLVLQNRIVTLQYKPGEYLNTAALMESLGFGRTPINHALHRLATEGLVQILPRKGVIVAPLSIDDALNLIDVRLVNETLCARLAAERITAEQIDELHHSVRSFEQAMHHRDIVGCMQADRNFHECIAQACANPVLIDVLRVLHARAQRFWAISMSATGHSQHILEEHRQIVDMLAAHDGEAAATMVGEHIESFRTSILQRN
ncbi:GntR family transcriptional regulator [Lampropedia puyangensis]|uniref:GntR family transcriptional regulator n=1 Tax=Lampropedia puyangensis TaxID=1330072 RepID=A0A4S8F8W9_9BURK|nr:GntR family transcriptional regulator [Lampropedia puyangensis]THU03697.1 GntR family transcriptional regulator [Lampropedia puyangensis]